MKKFVLDADSAIKLAKAGVLEQFAKNAKCLISNHVYDEIIRGKDKMYEDAFVAEKLVNEKTLQTVSVTLAETDESLGLGERSAKALFSRRGGDAIVSDDSRFLSGLEKDKVPFMLTTDAITWMVQSKSLSKKEGIAALDKIRKLVKESSYEWAKKAIGGEK